MERGYVRELDLSNCGPASVATRVGVVPGLRSSAARLYPSNSMSKVDALRALRRSGACFGCLGSCTGAAHVGPHHASLPPSGYLESLETSMS
ncbi:hypothetical protein VCV18_000641 [Metarhizium anisopliae]